MRKYYYSISVLTAIVVITLVFGFNDAGSPISQKAMNFDSQRVNHITSIKYAIDSYYSQNKKLPESLSQLPNYSLYKDPETNNDYEYNVTGGTSYSVCTNFSTDTKSLNRNPAPVIYDASNYPSYLHVKGYDCINLSVSSTYTTKPTPTTAIDDWQERKYTFYGSIESLAPSEIEPRMIVVENEFSRIVYVKNAVLLDKDGNDVKFNYFKHDDKVLVESSGVRATSYRADIVQNLSR